MQSVTTPLRYPGGKARALKYILPRIPRGIAEYREPFLGGASVFIAFKKQNPNLKFKINDLSPDVYCFWKTLQEDPDHLIKAINNIKNNCKDGRAIYRSLSSSKATGRFALALRFYILNRITYSGISDSGGYSNESFEKRFTSSKINDLWSLNRILENVDITNDSYERLLFEKGRDVFIFLDPPYWKPRTFPLYGKRGNMNKFFDHKKFAENVRKTDHKWLITCDDSPYIRELFSFAHISEWEMKYNGMHKGKAMQGKELFISNYKIEIQQEQTMLSS